MVEPVSSQTGEVPTRLVVGLGNPGPDYEGTRHNLGFEVLGRLAESFGLSLVRQARESGLGPVKARVARGSTEEGPFLLVAPWTYMNLSGNAVAAYARHLGVPPDLIFVIVDDLNLPLGRMRIRAGGSPGGHNGLKSLIACLGTEGFPRLRLGIAAESLDPAAMADPDFVLSRFAAAERAVLGPALAEAVEACRAWLSGTPLGDLMSRYNARPPTEPGAGRGAE